MVKRILAVALAIAVFSGPQAGAEPVAAPRAGQGEMHRPQGEERKPQNEVRKRRDEMRKQKGASAKADRGVECMTRARPGAPAPVTATVSAYSAEETGGARTATGRKPRRGIVAISPDLYEAGWTFGREICVSGHGVFVIGDLMGAKKAKAVDIFMDTRAKAVRFGRRHLKVRLLPVAGEAAPAASSVPAAPAAPSAPSAPAPSAPASAVP